MCYTFFYMPEGNPDTIRSEIAALEERIAQKRAELGQDVTAPYEKLEVQAAVDEQIQEQVPSYTASAVPASSGAPSWQDPALASDVQGLVTVAFTNGVAAAIAQAVASGNAALIDALHDVLADELHQELLKRGKISPSP